MTQGPEARLAREAEICYAGIAGVSDYDSWQDQAEPLSVDVILETLRKNVDVIQKIIKLSIAWLPPERDCECTRAMKTAVATDSKLIPAGQKKKLELLVGKYIKGAKP